MLKVYILDDEQHAIDGLSAMLKKKFAESIVVIGSNHRAHEAIDEIESLNPDVVFLDVEMPEMNGLDVLKYFPDRKFQIVFTTAHEKYALSAIKIETTDYLVKPISPSDMSEAIKKCILKNTQIQEKNSTDKITLTTAHELIIANLDEIIRIEAESNYSCFYFTNRPKMLISKTLKEFEFLEAKGFFRIHQSHLINLKHVLSLNSYEGDTVNLFGGHSVDVSRRKKAEFMALLKGK
jgi:two-component system, LytTR family, response regulator